MQVTRLVIENLRAVAHLEIDLAIAADQPRKRVVLLGVNGAGKTTILDAITHAFESLVGSHVMGGLELGAADVRNVDEPSLNPEAAPRSGSITIDAVLFAEERRVVRPLYPKAPAAGRLHFEIGGSELRFELPDGFWDLPMLGPDDAGAATRHEQQPEAQGRDNEGPDVGVALETYDTPRSALFQAPARAALAEQHPPCVFLPADRGILTHRDDLTLKQITSLDPRADCLSRSRDRFAALAPRLALASIDGGSDDGRAVARMWKVVEKYFPEMPKLAGTNGLQLRFRNKGGALVPLNALSDGERAILLILGELALRSPTWGVVLIDELEQHLHPRWQRAILQALGALLPSAQLILTTQSPYLAAAAADDAIKIGDWDRDGE